MCGVVGSSLGLRVCDVVWECHPGLDDDTVMMLVEVGVESFVWDLERGKKKGGKNLEGRFGEVGWVFEDRMIAVHHSQLYRSYYAPLFSSELSAREGDLLFFRSLH